MRSTRRRAATPRAIEWRRAEVGAVDGHGNARSIATIHSVLACGEANGFRLLSDTVRERALEPQSNGVDLVFGVATKWGMGFALEHAIVPNPLRHRLAFWVGNGGLLGLADLDERMSVSYVTNRWVEGAFEPSRFNRIIKAVFQGLGRG
ncbi:MAG: serine hydrolase [Steroidobacteraceae bacterium]